MRMVESGPALRRAALSEKEFRLKLSQGLYRLAPQLPKNTVADGPAIPAKVWALLRPGIAAKGIRQFQQKCGHFYAWELQQNDRIERFHDLRYAETLQALNIRMARQNEG